MSLSTVSAFLLRKQRESLCLGINLAFSCSRRKRRLTDLYSRVFELGPSQFNMTESHKIHANRHFRARLDERNTLHLMWKGEFHEAAFMHNSETVRKVNPGHMVG